MNRTLPLFADVGSPPPPKGPSRRTLLRRVTKAAIRWYRGEVPAELVLDAVRDLLTLPE